MAPSYWLIERESVMVGIPAGGEERAESFYGEILGMEVLPGGGFRSEGAQLRLDMQVPFRPVEQLAALVVSDFEALLARLSEHGMAAEGEQLEFFERLVVQDPFGNGLQLMAER
jgi:catechol 2,3-dioxygenase-like lactoylglutathione lyase family enzyme